SPHPRPRPTSSRTKTHTLREILRVCPWHPPENVYSNMEASTQEQKMKTLRRAIWLALGASLALRALAQSAPTPAQQQLREIYKELVEINTTDSAGSCTAA